MPYLNAAPLTAGIEHAVQFVVPSRLAEMLRANELDAALVSLAEVLFHDRYHVLDGVAIASAGAVFSVLLAHRCPVSQIAKVHCDTASLTGLHLLKVLLAEQNLRPEFCQLRNYAEASRCEAVLLIGDRAIDFQLAPHPDHQILDLGSAWRDLTGLPFVYAVWALRRELADDGPLRRALIAAKERGLATLPHIIRTHPQYTEAFRGKYFRRHVRYELGVEEKAGIRRFTELLGRQRLGAVQEPVYV